jgi:hypothetical protein
MADVLFVAIMLALFGASVLFIRACDHIIGADDDVVIGVTSDESDDTDGVLAV